MKFKLLYILPAFFLLASCNEFLDEPQDKRTTINTKETVAQLLVNAYADAQFAAFAEAMSDNADDKGNVGTQLQVNTDSYLWKDYESVTDVDGPTSFWESSYRAIAHANHALAALETMEGDASALAPLRGEALLARAYAHFLVVNFFSLRYDPATADTEPGIPYVTSPEENAVVAYARETIAETYRLIEADLVEGLALVTNDYKEPKFHFTQPAAHAFAARFYLYKADWAKVVEHANAVLGKGAPVLVIRDFVSAAYTSLTYSERTTQYSAATERTNLLITWPYTLQGRSFASYRYGLSASKMAELISDRRTNPFRKAWAYPIFGTDNVYNIPKYVEYFRITNVTAGTGVPYAGQVHFSNDEVLLNRAEAYAMLRQYAAAEADLTSFLSLKTDDFDATTDVVTMELMKTTYPVVAGEYTPFYTLTEDQAAFVKGIAEFRRREFYHEGFRWFDVKRFNLVVTHRQVGDAVITLAKDDARRAIQIPEAAQTYGIPANRR
jgi:starch-binding outer membrane protein, SusD/RagB family